MFKKVIAATIFATMSVAVLAQGTVAAPAASKPAATEQKAETTKPVGTVKTEAPKTADTAKVEAPKAPVAKRQKQLKRHPHAAKPAKPADTPAAVAPAK